MLVKYISREVSHWVSYWVSYWFRIGFVLVSHWRKLAWLSRAAAGPGRVGPDRARPNARPAGSSEAKLGRPTPERLDGHPKPYYSSKAKISNQI